LEKEERWKNCEGKSRNGEGNREIYFFF